MVLISCYPSASAPAGRLGEVSAPGRTFLLCYKSRRGARPRRPFRPRGWTPWAPTWWKESALHIFTIGDASSERLGRYECYAGKQGCTIHRGLPRDVLIDPEEVRRRPPL